MGDELTVGGMVDGLDADNLGAQRRRPVFGIFYEFSFGICWSRNVYGSSIRERFGRGAHSPTVRLPRMQKFRERHLCGCAAGAIWISEGLPSRTQRSRVVNTFATTHWVRRRVVSNWSRTS